MPKIRSPGLVLRSCRGFAIFSAEMIRPCTNERPSSLAICDETYEKIRDTVIEIDDGLHLLGNKEEIWRPEQSSTPVARSPARNRFGLWEALLRLGFAAVCQQLRTANHSSRTCKFRRVRDLLESMAGLPRREAVHMRSP